MTAGKEEASLLDVGEFIAEYASHMMGCGVHTSRVIRSSKRIVEAYGYLVQISIFQKSLILTLSDKKKHLYHNAVVDIPPLPISFEHNSRLSALSWEVHDEHLSFTTLKEKYQQILSAPAIHPLFVLLLAGAANAAFCRLFGGDWLSTSIVFSATLAGMSLKQRMSHSLNHYVVFILSAFVASLCASTSLIFNTTSDIALATSVLFLVPGVPLINGVIDIVEGHVLTGFSRLIHASLLLLCIAIGLAVTLFLIKDNLI